MKKLLLIPVLACLLPGCSSEAPEQQSTVETPIELTAAERVASDKVSAFEYEFFKKSCADTDANVLVSPVGVSINLSMLAHAANAQSAAEISSLLGCADTDALASYTRKLLSDLPTVDNKTSIVLANSVWCNDRLSLTKQFETAVRTCHNAEIYKAPLYQSTKEVDSWVNDKTRGLIETLDILPDESLSAIIANALYFKGLWSTPFEVANTSEAVFHGSKAEKAVSMMHINRKFEVRAGEYGSAVRVPFGNKSIEAIFVLPTDDATPEKALENGLFDTAEYKTYDTDLALPRFRMGENESVNCTKLLVDMGLNCFKEFEYGNLFTEQVPQLLRMNQKSIIEFDENGATGASVTGTGAVIDNYAPHIALDFDRPFVFFIRETNSGTLLFAGRVNNL